MPSRTWLLLVSFITACGGGGPVPDGGGPADHPPLPDGGPDAGGGVGDGAIPGDDSPITGRPSRGTYQCRVERDRTDHTPRTWGVFPPALVETTGGKTFLVRLEAISTMPFFPPPLQLVVSSFDAGGTFGPSTSIPLLKPEEGSSVTAAPRGDGFLALWIDDGKLRLAAFDAAGQMVLAPREVLSGVDASSRPVLAAGPDGSFGLVYAPPMGPATSGSREVRFAVLDAMGGLRAAPRTLTAMPGTSFALPAPAIAATADGYAMIWRDPASTSGGIDFASASTTGAELIARHRVSAPVEPGLVVGGVGGFEEPRHSLLPIGEGFLAAWTEVRRGDGQQGAGSVARLARLDARGNRLGDAAAMRAFQGDVDEVEPSLIPFGDAVAVLWGHGSHIYICGGCVPDHRIDLLLVDPSTLAPLGDVVSVTNGGNPQAGGLLRHQVAVAGDSLLVPYLLTFHVHATAGSAAFGCTKK